MNRNHIATFLVATVINVTALLAIELLVPASMPPVNYIFVGALAIATMIMYVVMQHAHKTQSGLFISFFMLSVLVKMTVTLSLLFGYLYFNPEEKLPVAISFLCTYFLFTGIEVVLLYRQLQQK